jgi:hypothetical protein
MTKPEKRKVWVATWWAVNYTPTMGDIAGAVVSQQFTTRESALEWVGGRRLISLVEVEVPDE